MKRQSALARLREILDRWDDYINGHRRYPQADDSEWLAGYLKEKEEYRRAVEARNQASLDAWRQARLR